MQNSEFQTILNVCPPEIIEDITRKLNSLPTNDRKVLIVSFNNEGDSQICKEICSHLETKGCIVEIINSTLEIANLESFTKFVLVFDATEPIVERHVRCMEWIARNSALRNNVAIVLNNLSNVMSRSEAIHNIRLVLERKQLSAHIFSEVGEELYQFISDSSVDVQDIKMQYVKDAIFRVRSALDDNYAKTEDEKRAFQARWSDFQRKKKSMEVRSNQLFLDLWIAIKQFCNTELDTDTRAFAATMLSELNEVVKTMDVNQVRYFFPMYINYLWGQFLNNEMLELREYLDSELKEKRSELMAQYQTFFDETLKIQEAAAKSLAVGAPPIAYDIQHYNDILNDLFDIFVGNWIRYKLIIVGDWVTGGKLSDKFVQILNRLVTPLLRLSRSDKDKRNDYAEMVYHVFKDSVNDTVALFKDYLVPAMEQNYKESIEAATKEINKGLNLIEGRLRTYAESLDARLIDLQQRIHLVESIQNNIKL